MDERLNQRIARAFATNSRSRANQNPSLRTPPAGQTAAIVRIIRSGWAQAQCCTRWFAASRCDQLAKPQAVY